MIITSKTNQARLLMHNGLLALNRATKRGMRIDVGYCKEMDIKLTKKLKTLEKRIRGTKFGKKWQKHYKMNIKSDVQLTDLLFKKMKMPVVKLTDKGNPSTSAECLDILSKEIPDLKLLAKYKILYVTHNTFIKAFLREQVDGYIHPGFYLHLIKTFRSSSEGPNFQQMPKRNKLQKRIVRRAIIPEKGFMLLEADYSGIEVRVACCVTKDKKLAYDTVHGDMHRDMAVEIFMLDEFLKKASEKDLRFAAKNGFVFPQFYGDYWKHCVPTLLKLSDMPLKGRFKKKDGFRLMTGINLGEHLNKKGIKSVKNFEHHIESLEQNFWQERYKTYGKWKKKQIKQYKEKGYLETVTGFTCQGVMSKNEITNYPMQGPAFHTLLNSFIEIDRREQAQGWKSFQTGQIHDATVLNVHPKEKDYVLENLKEVMIDHAKKTFKWINIPLEVEADIYEVDAPWSESAETIVF